MHDVSSFQLPMKSLADDALFDAASSVVTSSDFQSPRNLPPRKNSSAELLVRKDSASTLEGIVEQQHNISRDSSSNSLPTINYIEREKIKNSRSTGVVEQILDSFTILCNTEASNGFCRTSDPGLTVINETGPTVTKKRLIQQSRHDVDCVTSDDYLGLIDECQVPRSQMSNLSNPNSDILDTLEIN